MIALETFDYARKRFIEMILEEGVSFEEACERRRNFLSPILREPVLKKFHCFDCLTTSNEPFYWYKNTWSQSQCRHCRNKRKQERDAAKKKFPRS